MQALYLVEEHDRAFLSGLSEAADPLRSRFYLLQKAAYGGQSYSLIPGLVRDRSTRKQALQAVRSLSRAIVAEVFVDANDSEIEIEEGGHLPVLTAENLSLLTTMLESDDEQLNNVPLLQSFAAALETAGDERLDRAAKAVRAAYAYSLRNIRTDQAAEILRSRVPGFLQFTDADRAFETDNDLAEVAADPPRALGNLASLAGLGLSQVLRLMEEDDSGTLVSVLDRANAALESALKSWSREEITVRFDRQGGTVLRIHVSDAAGGYTKLDERSDGLKVFVALLALTAQGSYPDRPPIVLIDELGPSTPYITTLRPTSFRSLPGRSTSDKSSTRPIRPDVCPKTSAPESG